MTAQGIELVGNYEQLRKERGQSVAEMTDYIKTIDPAFALTYEKHASDDPADVEPLLVSINAATSDPGTNAIDTTIVAEDNGKGVNTGSGPTPAAVGTGAQAPQQADDVPGTADLGPAESAGSGSAEGQQERASKDKKRTATPRGKTAEA